MWDDGNENWEDIPFIDDIEIQRWAQKDDIESLEILPTETEAEGAPDERLAFISFSIFFQTQILVIN